MSYRQLQLRLEALGQSIESIDAVFITHEHGDHVKGLGTLARRHGVPAYLTGPTFACLPEQVGALPRAELFEAGETLVFRDLEVASFSVSHDAVDPVSFTVRARGAKLGFATDLGHCSHLVRTRLAGSHALVLESNYCPDMLREGGYPPRIQQRIRSRQGHLSNQAMTSLLADLMHDALHTVVLVHVSENNNTADRVQRMVSGVMKRHPAQVHIALQDAATPLFEVRP